MRTWRFTASSLVMFLTLSGAMALTGAPTAAQSTTTTVPAESPSDSLSSDQQTTTTAGGPSCPDPDLVEVSVVFTGEPSDTEDDTLVFEDIAVESGLARPPVVVAYPDGLPVIEDVGPLRVRAVETASGFRSEVECGGTTSIDDEVLEVDDDRLAALARTAGDFSSRLGRWALLASGATFAAVVLLTLFRRWRPPLW